MKTNTYLQTALNSIAGLRAGTRFTLPELFGERWNELTQTINPNRFGQEFSHAVETGEIPDVQFVEVNRSPRISIYVKIEK